MVAHLWEGHAALWHSLLQYRTVEHPPQRLYSRLSRSCREHCSQYALTVGAPGNALTMAGDMVGARADGSSARRRDGDLRGSSSAHFHVRNNNSASMSVTMDLVLICGSHALGRFYSTSIEDFMGGTCRVAMPADWPAHAAHCFSLERWARAGSCKSQHSRIGDTELRGISQLTDNANLSCPSCQRVPCYRLSRPTEGGDELIVY